MRIRRDYFLVFFAVLSASLFSNVVLSIDLSKDSIPTISLNDLTNSEIPISITKRKFYGVNLDGTVSSKFCQGDSLSFSSIDYNDQGWLKLTNSEGNAFEIDKVYWSRMKFRVAQELLIKQSRFI